MSIFRVRFDVAGGHVHCRVFAADGPNRTFANCGTIVVRKGEEFASLMDKFSADFIGDDHSVGVVEARTP